MKLHLDKPGNLNVINGHSPEGVIVNGRLYTGSLVVLPDELVENWTSGDEPLSARHFDALLDVTPLRTPEIVLLGTGERQHFPPPALYARLINAGIGVEVMNTAAACRTYNLLAGEGRRVAAALLPYSFSTS